MAYDDETMYESGDQDYDSAIGWERENIRKLKEKARKAVVKESPEMLYSKRMDDWMRTAKEISASEELFGPFWLSGELAVLFSSAGVGKSLLATQIAESLARGVRLFPFDASPAPAQPPQRVLYLDFELTREQLLIRYSAVGDDGVTLETPYSFSPDIIRSEMYWNGHVAAGYESFSDMLFEDIREIVEEARIETLIVDNITFLDRTSTTNVNASLGIMRRLNELKRLQFLSILVLAHTPKRHGPPGELTEGDLQGSVNLSNFADSIFAIGRSAASPDLRYLKQIKVRSGRVEFDRTNVVVYRVGKFDLAKCLGITGRTDRRPLNNFLGFSFVEIAAETAQVEAPRTTATKDERRTKKAIAKSLAKKGSSASFVAAELGVSKATAHRFMQKGKT